MRLWLVAKSNMKKKKSNVAVLCLLIMLAAALLYTSVSILSNVTTFIDEKSEAVKGAHVQLMASKGYDKEIESTVKSMDHYKMMEKQDGLVTVGSANIRNTDLGDESENMPMMFSKYRQSGHDKIFDYKVIDKGEELKADSIVLPAYMKVAKGYKTGDNFTMKLSGREYIFEIYGFVEDTMFSTPSNISLYKCFIPSEKYDELQKECSGLSNIRNYMIRLDNMDNSEPFDSTLAKKLSEQIKDTEFHVLWQVNYTSMRDGTAVFISILMAVLAMFAVLIILIALVVIRFSINMNIENNLPNIGIMQALGYTTGQIRRATILEYLIISVCGSIVGIVAAIGCSSVVAEIVSQAIGLIWVPEIDIKVMVLTVIAIVAIAVSITFMTAFKYRKITPLNALRNGIHTHNFRKNYLPLSQSKFSLNSSLGLKEIFNSKKQNASILVIVSLLALSCTMMLALYYNFVVDQKALINLVGIEKPNILITDKCEDDETGITIDTLQKELENRDDVSDVMKYSCVNATVKSGDKEASIVNNVYENPSDVNIDTLIDGRYPEHDNEISVTNVVKKKLGIQIGDSVRVAALGNEETYIVVGISQQISNLGLCMVMSEEGAIRLNSECTFNDLYIYLKDPDKTSAMTDEFIDKYGKYDGIQVDNFDAIYNTILGTYINSLVSLCIVFVVVTILVIVLIIILVLKMKMARDRVNMGVYKAIGYTTPQLIWQNVMSFAPVVSAGGLIGVILAKLCVNKSFAMMLSISGIENAALTVSPMLIAGIFAAITLLAFVVSVFGSLKVRKIEPYKMITEN